MFPGLHICIIGCLDDMDGLHVLHLSMFACFHFCMFQCLHVSMFSIFPCFHVFTVTRSPGVRLDRLQAFGSRLSHMRRPSTDPDESILPLQVCVS